MKNTKQYTITLHCTNVDISVLVSALTEYEKTAKGQRSFVASDLLRLISSQKILQDLDAEQVRELAREMERSKL